jgi:hypothetical protein
MAECGLKMARQFHETHDMGVKEEIDRLTMEYGKLGERWVGEAWQAQEKPLKGRC